MLPSTTKTNKRNITMNDNVQLGFQLAWATIAGMALGGGFFGGLWWSVRRGAASANPALWFGGSMVLRTALVLGGFYLVSGAQWPRMTACLVGFYMARLTVLRLTRPAIAEVPHAS